MSRATFEGFLNEALHLILCSRSAQMILQTTMNISHIYNCQIMIVSRLDQNNNHRDIDENVVDQPIGKRRTTKKGIIITALIVTAMIGASFIVYFIP